MNALLQSRSFVFLAVLFVAAESAAAAEQAVGADRPNVVWIFVEDMNGWYGCYGDDTVPTPNIDALAKRGVRFDRAYMPAGVCSATRSAIATGAMQTSLGIHNHRSSRGRVPGEVIHLPGGVKTVYQLMREAGYYVYSSKGKNDFNFEFDLADLYDDIAGNIGYSGPQWRERPIGKPFFAQIQLRGGKNTGVYKGSPAAKNRGASGTRRARESGPFTDPAKTKVAPYYPDVPVMRREYAHHYDTIRQTDDEVGEIMSALKSDGLLENTLVFFWTDHGFRAYRHKQWLYEGGIHVPLIVAGPSIDKDSSRNDLVSGIDITVSSLAAGAVQPGEWMEGPDLFAADYVEREYVISARDRCDYTIERVRAVTTKRYKYLRNFLTDRPFMQPQYRDGRDYIEIPRQMYEEGRLNSLQAFWWSPTRVPEELYDLHSDPHETRNLADDADHADVLARHRSILAKWMENTDDKGQYAESVESLQGVLTQWDKQAVNPEYDKARAAQDK